MNPVTAIRRWAKTKLMAKRHLYAVNGKASYLVIGDPSENLSKNAELSGMGLEGHLVEKLKSTTSHCQSIINIQLLWMRFRMGHNQAILSCQRILCHSRFFGFMSPKSIWLNIRSRTGFGLADEKLALVVGPKPLPRTELTKKLWAYIRKNGLQDKKVRTQINADENLKAVFNGKKSVSMFEMTKLVSGHVK
jgi:hypothetical protein